MIICVVLFCLIVISNEVRDLGASAPQYYASLDFSLALEITKIH